MKIFIQNQCIIKKFKNFSFFLGDFDLSGLFTLCQANKKIEKSEYDFSIFSLVLYVRNFLKG